MGQGREGAHWRTLWLEAERTYLSWRKGTSCEEVENSCPKEVFVKKRYKTKETWLNKDGKEFVPGMHYYVGGNTKLYGAALARMRKEDFGELRLLDGVSPAWPIAYEELEPYYAQAEKLYNVHGAQGEDPSEPPRSSPFPKPPIPHEPQIEELAKNLQSQGLHPFPLPIGIDLDEPDRLTGRCFRCMTCDGFPCPALAKSDADVNAVRPAREYRNVTLIRNAEVRKLITAPDGKRVVAVEAWATNERQEKEVQRFESELVVVSCGAVNSAALLLRSASDKHPNGLANSSGLVGRNYMAHLNGTVMAVHPWRRNRTVFQKTLAMNDWYFKGPGCDYPLGNVQLIGKLQKKMLLADQPWLPGPLSMYLADHSVDWWVLSEDLPKAENQVTLTREGKIQVSLATPTNVGAHRRLMTELCRALRQAGYWLILAKRWPSDENCSHQVGTLKFGRDPRTSVLNEYCRAHEVENLFVVDGSFFPSSAAVNPALTIMAQALRVGAWMRKNC